MPEPMFPASEAPVKLPDAPPPLLERASSLIDAKRSASAMFRKMRKPPELKSWRKWLLRTPPRITFAFAVCCFLITVCLGGGPTALRPAPILLGCTLYTFFEYAIHRFGLHVIPLALGGRELYRVAHGRHHIFFFPQEADRVVFPLSHVLAFLLPPMAVFRLAVGHENGWTVVATSIVCHICNEFIHLYAHGQFGRKRIFEASRYYHLLHHLVSGKTAFGFCSPWWDFALGTLPRSFTAAGGASLALRAIVASPIPVPFVHWVLLGLIAPEPFLHPVMERAYAQQNGKGSQCTRCTAHCVATLSHPPEGAVPPGVLCKLVHQGIGVAHDQISIGEVVLVPTKERAEPQILFEFEVKGVTDEILGRIKGGWRLDLEELNNMHIVNAAGRVHSVIGHVEDPEHQQDQPSESHPTAPTLSQHS